MMAPIPKKRQRRMSSSDSAVTSSQNGNDKTDTPSASESHSSSSREHEEEQNILPGEIKFPTGCKTINLNMRVDELIKGLKGISSKFQTISQAELNDTSPYVPLCHYLTEEEFLNHPNRDVRLLVACCIADILRIFAPKAPYTTPDQIKKIFTFLTNELVGLKDPKNAAFKRYFYLLENLAFVKSFNMCCELDDSDDVICNLFKMIFDIIGDEHSEKVKSFMLDILSSVITDNDIISGQLVYVILEKLVEPFKSSKKQAYSLAKQLIVKCADEIEPYIQTFFNEVLIGEAETDFPIAHKIYDLIYEFNSLCPSILITVLPQLEYKLKSPVESDRLGSVSMLALMFSEKGSNLAEQHNQLWLSFVGRFNDISAAIRTKCVQYSMHFLINHPNLRQDIVGALSVRQHDHEEMVRLEVVKAVAATAKLNFRVVSESENLMNFLKERALDKKFKIRREALQSLAYIYHEYLENENVPEPLDRAVEWIKNKVLHGYYMANLEDRALVEKLLNSFLVPYKLATRDRMTALLYLYSTIDTNASKAFVEILKNLILIRRHVYEFTNLLRNSRREPEYAKLINDKITLLVKFLPDPVKASEFICKFSNDLQDDSNLMNAMQAAVSPTSDCKTCSENVTIVLKKLGAPVMTNLYYSTIKSLLERSSSVLIDKEAVKELVAILRQIVDGNSTFPSTFKVLPVVATEKGFDLISVLGFLFPDHCDSSEVLEILVGLLNENNMTFETTCKILLTLTYVGKKTPLYENQELMKSLLSYCKTALTTGPASLGKLAVRCLFANMKDPARTSAFKKIFKNILANLNPSNVNFRTSIIAVGHIANLMPEEFKTEMKSTISKKIVKGLLIKPPSTSETHSLGEGDWCEEEDLPEITRCMIAGMKTFVRWLIGLKDDFDSARKAYKMLIAFVETSGAFNDPIEGRVVSNAEKAWLRLTAGCCMLKMCTYKGVGDQFTAAQFCSLSKLMIDEVLQVRTRFASKLHKGLSRNIQTCLPLDFMGYYALAGYETDKKLRDCIRANMIADVNQRREYIKALLSKAADKAAEQLPHIMPDYMVAFAIPVLVHSSKFTSHTDPEQLNSVMECLWFILEPLTGKTDSYSFGFYTKLLERVKRCLNAIEPEDEEANDRMYVICDAIVGLLVHRAPYFEMNDYPIEPRVPPMYFRRHSDPTFVNLKNYPIVHSQLEVANKSLKERKLSDDQSPSGPNLRRSSLRNPNGKTEIKLKTRRASNASS